MIYLFTYEEIKRLNEQRRNRSLTAYQTSRSRTAPVERTGQPADAEVIEILFGAQCDHDRRIGA